MHPLKAFAAGAVLTWCYDHRAGFRREWRFACQDVRDLRDELQVRFAG